MSQTAKIVLDKNEHDLPVVTGSESENAIDISKLRASTGYITIDPGYKNTGATTSAITFLDGEKGILRYRGYPIEQLAANASFMEVAYLLIYGELPNAIELQVYERSIKRHTLVHEDMKRFFEAYPAKAHPMGVLSSMVSSLATFYPESQNPDRNSEAVNLTIHRLIAKLPTLAAWSYKNSMRHPFMYPNNKFDYCENFLNMMFSMPTEDYNIDPVIVDALNKLLILHADHEQNCSTSTVRIVGSSQANLYSSISAGICALWGPLHGGANQKVIEMLLKIHIDGGNVDKWVEKAKDKNDSFRLMGFGHRVYKNFDPRAKVMQKICHEVLDHLGIKDDPLLAIAVELEKIALEDDYFVEKKLYPNIDFYSGIVMKSLGFPMDMFTVLFAVGRTVGWVSQWNEMIEDTSQRIGRPRQLYVGSEHRQYIGMHKR